MNELNGKTVYVVELRAFVERYKISTLAYIGSSFENAEQFVADRRQSAGEMGSWWAIFPTTIDNPSPITSVGNGRFYDLFGARIENQPTVEEAYQPRFQGEPLNIVKV
jgi:hypothetical protein